ncbi:LysR family transcriptional regulator [Salinicola salarius]|jgi:DNA-binding transcriptional LysR family regulator|uniref:LysR family transcriptional regulator n=1 Tax=Salinicola salarius TaxID=430457 RepID=UPI000B3F9668|nr:LysR family transcriptional regulator [Salinicola salarius]
MRTPQLRDRQILAFKWMMECGTVTAAAQRMRTAQPGVTRLLKQLEHDVGFALFERVRGRLTPTPEARLFHREVVSVWRGIDHLRDTATRIREREVGGLRISTMPLLGMTFVPDVLADFVPEHPDADVELTTFRSEQVIDEVMTQRCDLGFAIVAENEDRVDQTRYRLPSLCAMFPDHPLARRDVIAISDLDDQALICFERHDPLRIELDRRLESAGARPRRRIEVSLALQATRLVSHGLGIAILDPISAASWGQDGVTLKPLAVELGEDFSLLTPRDQPLSQLAQAFRAAFLRKLETLNLSSWS